MDEFLVHLHDRQMVFEPTKGQTRRTYRPWLQSYAAGIDPEDEAFDSDDDSYMYVARPSVPLVNGRPLIRPPPRRPPPRIVPLPLDWNNDDDDDSLPSLAPRPLSDSEDERLCSDTHQRKRESAA